MEDEDLEELRKDLGWVVDVPLFIDDKRVSSLYDITVEPVFSPYRKEEVAGQDEEENQSQVHASGNANLTVKTNSFFDFIGGGEVGVDGGLEYDKQNREQEIISYEAVRTPQRQLAQVLLKYRYSDITSDGPEDGNRRYEYVEDVSEFEWDDVTRDKSSPRDLLVLELPGSPQIHDEDGEWYGNYRTTLVPTAAEFEGGEVVPIYPKLESDFEKPPRYPQRDLVWNELGKYYERKCDEYSIGQKVGGNLRAARNAYWQWFYENFNAKDATRTIEEVAADNGRMRWIDFRLPVSEDGQTLHLHISAREQYDTGTFAYNFVKRGYKHGLILVGTLKSEPDMDVLAIYER